MILTLPRLVIAGLSGDAGKTMVAVGVAAALRRTGLEIAPYKKGPDYIDAAWLGAACGRPGRNLDTFLMDDRAIAASVARAAGADFLLVEGNRGLHDGVEGEARHSTAELAKRLRAPVILVADAAKTTRTLAACVRGCAVVDPTLDIAGVVLNRVANERHERVVREALAEFDGPPVVGVIPRLRSDPLPSRHLGLVTAVEHGNRDQALSTLERLAADHLDLERVRLIAANAGRLELPDDRAAAVPAGERVRIAVLHDEAFSFYYPENLEALAAAGAEIVDVSPLHDAVLPRVDALYAGGGFPEVQAPRLAANDGFASSLRAAAGQGLPIYAECGGLMYLARELRVGGRSFPMAGVLDLVVEQTDRPQGHGYLEGRVDSPNSFFPVGTTLRGHEFHYSRLVAGQAPRTALHVTRGAGLGGGRDAVVQGSIWASYLHVHALATPSWAVNFLAAARGHRDHRVEKATAK